MKFGFCLLRRLLDKIIRWFSSVNISSNFIQFRLTHYEKLIALPWAGVSRVQQRIVIEDSIRNLVFFLGSSGETIFFNNTRRAIMHLLEFSWRNSWKQSRTSNRIKEILPFKNLIFSDSVKFQFVLLYYLVCTFFIQKLLNILKFTSVEKCTSLFKSF